MADYITQANNYSYYAFYATDPALPVVITVTPVSGDPDLFVTTQGPFANTCTLPFVCVRVCIRVCVCVYVLCMYVRELLNQTVGIYSSICLL